MGQDREILIQRFLELSEALYDIVVPTLSLDKVASDVTVAQLRVLIVLRHGGPSPMSSLAASARVVPSSATGIVDNLVGRGLVLREDDPRDRRRVICRLSPAGQEMVDGLWTWGRSQVERLLERLTEDQLENACEVTEALYNGVIGQDEQVLSEIKGGTQ